MTVDSSADLALVDDRPHLVALDGFRQRAETYADARRSKGTRRAYGSDFADYTSWCHTHGMVPLPGMAPAVAMYVTACADRGLAVSSIGRRLAAIAYYHRDAGLETPTRHPVVLAVWEGVRRTIGVAQVGKDAIVTEQLRALVAPLGSSPLDVRDRALLLVTFAGAFRRSEVVGFDAIDARFVADGVTLHLRKSKTDQEGAGALVGIAYGSHLATCPVRALRAWTDLAGAIDDGPLFRRVRSGGRVTSERLTAQSVALIVKRHAVRAGLDPDNFGGHSLRAGFVTTAALAGMSESKIMRQTRHKSSATLQRYIRPATVWTDNASADVGL
jgi:site-specific recombinase XerD